MTILIIEPYFTGSHAAWARGYQKYSSHHVEILSLKGQFWKWRMHGGAVTLARRFSSQNTEPDLILATDMLDVTTFLALTRDRTHNTPVALYFHENQLAYPWSPDDRDVSQNRDKHYGFINYSSALAADRVFFNSAYNRNTFLTLLEPLLKHFPDYNELESLAKIREKSSVLPLGLDLSRFDKYRVEQVNEPPILLWNHRWEHDKNPADFFRAANRLEKSGVDFRLAILGENFRNSPKEFDRALKRHKDRIVQWGFVKKFSEYAQWLWRADIVPVTSVHDFFGISVAEAIYCGCVPLLPNRLAYPELVPPGESNCFYENFDEFVKKLEFLITNRGEVKLLSEAVEQFKWENMAPVYDATFESMIRAGFIQRPSHRLFENR